VRSFLVVGLVTARDLVVNVFVWYYLNMNLTPSQRDEISALLRANGAVIGYLFGSYARGTAGVLSDVDVAVAFPDNLPKETQDNRIEDIRSGLEKMFGIDKADVVNIAEIKNPLLRYVIMLDEGAPLFVDDFSLKNRFARYALQEYEDTRHLRMIQSQALSGLFVKPTLQ
jgi:predicted nucleotidyltransferase